MPTLFSRVQLLKITRLILPFLLFLCACGHESANRKAGAAITLAQVQNPAGCLNAKLYFDLFQAMDGNVPIRLMTTGFSTNTAVQNDLLLLAYRSFQFEELPRSNVTEFFPVDQKDCDSLSYGPNGESVFKVQSASKEKLTVKNEDGEAHSYRWLSPTSIEIEDTYVLEGFGCGGGEKTRYTTVRVFEWNTQNSITDVRMPENEIDEGYLSLVSQALALDPSSFYENTESSRVLRGDRLLQIQGMDPRAELLECQ